MNTILINTMEQSYVQIADGIHTNMDIIINDEYYARGEYQKVVTHEEIINRLKLFELINYEPAEKCDDIEILKEKSIEIMEYFDGFIEGSEYFEDDKWVCCNKCEYFDLNKNQKAIFNTISNKNNDKKIINYMSLIINYLNRHINKEKIKIQYKFINYDKYNMIFTTIIFEKI